MSDAAAGPLFAGTPVIPPVVPDPPPTGDPLVRPADPETSHDAAANQTDAAISENQLKFVEAVRALGTATAPEVANWWKAPPRNATEKQQRTIRRRQTEVVENGLVEICDERRDGCRVFRMPRGAQ